jgi:hypothetical protein
MIFCLFRGWHADRNQGCEFGNIGQPETTGFAAASGNYTVIVVPYNAPDVPFNGKISLAGPGTIAAAPTPVPAPQTVPDVPRYQNYVSPPTLGNSAGEPSVGVDWLVKDPALRPTSANPKLNTGGPSFFTAGNQELRTSYDDCSSPAKAVWKDVSSPFVVQAPLSDPIGTVDFRTGRVFQGNLIGGEGNSFWLTRMMTEIPANRQRVAAPVRVLTTRASVLAPSMKTRSLSRFIRCTRPPFTIARRASATRHARVAMTAGKPLARRCRFILFSSAVAYTVTLRLRRTAQLTYRTKVAAALLLAAPLKAWPFRKTTVRRGRCDPSLGRLRAATIRQSASAQTARFTSVIRMATAMPR